MINFSEYKEALDYAKRYFLNDLNILSKDSYIEVDDNFETKQKGIYAVGDCVFKPHYQIVIAMSEAARCALKVREDIHE